MASADSALLVIAKALWNPKPTTDDKSERFLANALGYPRSWRVERRIEENSKNSKTVNVDRIFAGPKDAGPDTYFNHPAAQAAAAEWVEGESTGYENKGGQLLPRKPRFQKGDRVKVNYEGQWCPATIKKRTEKKEGYRYTVYYPEDGTTQTQVEEEAIEHADDPVEEAKKLGLTGGWQAKLSGKKWKYISPDGKTFTSKASALKHHKKMEKGAKSGGSGKKRGTPRNSKGKVNYSEDDPEEGGGGAANDLSEGDPPWRTTGHEYLGRRLRSSTQHQKSATRTVTIEQVGTVVGWIADTDVDTSGEPGFISEKSGKPANLFHCVFDDEPSHPYFSLLVEAKDFEEFEVAEALIEEEPSKKKAKK